MTEVCYINTFFGNDGLIKHEPDTTDGLTPSILFRLNTNFFILAAHCSDREDTSACVRLGDAWSQKASLGLGFLDI